MRKKRTLKYINEQDMKECHTCRKVYQNPSQYFFKDVTQPYGLCKICKACDMERQNRKRLERAYFNVPINCITCNKRFFTARCRLNQGKKIGSNFGKYCLECSPLMTGLIKKSWNGRRRGSNNPSAKYDESFVKNIKEMIEKGLRNKDIASEFGVKPTYVSHIRTKRIWSHL
jgi:hypothetical protein